MVCTAGGCVWSVDLLAGDMVAGCCIFIWLVAALTSRAQGVTTIPCTTYTLECCNSSSLQILLCRHIDLQRSSPVAGGQTSRLRPRLIAPEPNGLEETVSLHHPAASSRINQPKNRGQKACLLYITCKCFIEIYLLNWTIDLHWEQSSCITPTTNEVAHN